MPTIRLGLVTLPLAGLLATWATIAGSTFLDFTDAGVDAGEAARAYDSLGYFLSQFMGYIVGLSLLTLGTFALTVYLAELRGERWVLGATILSILGTGLLLSHYGLRTYALPALGGAYLGGQENALESANIIFGDPGESVFYVAFLLYSAGFILFGFAVWGSGTLPRWSGVLLALHAPLFSGPLPELFSILGALMLLGGGGWIAYAVLRRPPARVVPERTEPRERTVTRLRKTGTE
ncbi:MAG: hypothetical protein LC781_15445 [Actinobacteria bacterium]|nr:hypothetical protein [Actinomycetota bacterium]